MRRLEFLHGIVLSGLLCGFAFAASPAIEKHERQYELGLAYMTATRAMPVDKGFDLIAQAADVAYIQGHWQEWETKGLFDKEIELARARGLKIYLALDLLGYAPPRAKLERLPSGLSGDFSTPAVQDAYRQLVKKLVHQHKPHYFNLLVEASLHKEHNPKSYAAFRELSARVYKEAKPLSPQTRFCVSLTYDIDKKQAVETMGSDFDAATDVFAISTYPFSVQHPAQLPEDFLAVMAGYSKKPLFISETSWVSSSFEIPLPDGRKHLFKASNDIQAEYVARLCKAAKFAQEKGKKIAAINFVGLVDPPAHVNAAILKEYPEFEWFCTLGLIETSGKEKAAFGMLKDWKSLKRR